MPISINECYFVKSDGVLISADSLLAWPWECAARCSPRCEKERACPPPSLPPPQNLQLHTHSCLNENHPRFWAMLPAASNKTFSLPSPALGKQTHWELGEWKTRGDHIPRPFCQESRSCSLGIHHHQQSSADPSSSFPTEELLVSCSLALPWQSVG